MSDSQEAGASTHTAGLGTTSAKTRGRLRLPGYRLRHSILEYHHFDPPWEKEKHHDPARMIALCADSPCQGWRLDGRAVPGDEAHSPKIGLTCRASSSGCVTMFWLWWAEASITKRPTW